MLRNHQNEIAGWLDSGTRALQKARELAAGTEAEHLIATLVNSANIVADRVRRDPTLTVVPTPKAE